MKLTRVNLMITAFLLLASGVVFGQSSPSIKNGYYRAVLKRKDAKEIVFNFQAKDSAGRKILHVINAEERLLVDSIWSTKDSVYFQMPFFEAAFSAKADKKGNLEGWYTKNLGDRLLQMPFTATYNERARFLNTKKARVNASGRWAVQFKSKSDTTEAVGEFSQTGNQLVGTFLTPTGDYRYLQGVVSGDSLMLSAFDGGHAFLFTGEVQNGQITNGYYYSSATGVKTWDAVRNDSAKLSDGYDATSVRAEDSVLRFRYPDLNGNPVSISDDRYKGKVVIVQIMGSWCPNCMDETRFLSKYYDSNYKRGLEIIGLAYERTTDFEKSKSSLSRYSNRFQIRYPLLITGVTVSDPQRTEKTLPQLTTIKAFPTTIFIDKKGKIRKIHSGFTGPGTGEHYQHFVKEFEQTVAQLLAE